MENIVIIKYNAGNIGSVANALKRLDVNYKISADPDVIGKADKVIFPGVGEASSTMKNLRERGLDVLIPRLRQPVLVICLGMQLMCAWSEEGDTRGLGIFKERVYKFRINEKVPHMGWNTLMPSTDPLLTDLPEQAWFYFVHSFYAESGESTVASCEYGISFGAYLKKDNFYGVQFHPEKSGKTGSKFIQNFIAL